ncbi:MAG TPA: hypothetical protein VNA30_05025 [Mycobacteriales bacterium]|nr:hypothetical protein [Mycobacteriales bacterium]
MSRRLSAGAGTALLALALATPTAAWAEAPISPAGGADPGSAAESTAAVSEAPASAPAAALIQPDVQANLHVDGHPSNDAAGSDNTPNANANPNAFANAASDPGPNTNQGNDNNGTGPGNNGNGTPPSDGATGPGNNGNNGDNGSNAAKDKAPGNDKDPGGNNGNISVTQGPGCTVVLSFKNFDLNQHADITFTNQAADGDVLNTYINRVISTTPADGSPEAGHTLVVSAADLGLMGVEQGPQGYHLQVAVDAVEAPGGAKQKTFWLSCPEGEAIAANTAALPPVLAPEVGEYIAPGAVPVVGPVVPDAAGPQFRSRLTTPVFGPTVPVAGPVAAEGQLPTFGSGALSLAAQEATSVPAASLLRAKAAVPAQLPSTGAAGLQGGLTAGLGSIAAGLLMLVGARRRTA